MPRAAVPGQRERDPARGAESRSCASCAVTATVDGQSRGRYTSSRFQTTRVLAQSGTLHPYLATVCFRARWCSRMRWCCAAPLAVNLLRVVGFPVLLRPTNCTKGASRPERVGSTMRSAGLNIRVLPWHWGRESPTASRHAHFLSFAGVNARATRSECPDLRLGQLLTKDPKPTSHLHAVIQVTRIALQSVRVPSALLAVRITGNRSLHHGCASIRRQGWHLIAQALKTPPSRGTPLCANGLIGAATSGKCGPATAG